MECKGGSNVKGVLVRARAFVVLVLCMDVVRTRVRG